MFAIEERLSLVDGTQGWSQRLKSSVHPWPSLASLAVLSELDTACLAMEAGQVGGALIWYCVSFTLPLSTYSFIKRPIVIIIIIIGS